MGEKLKILAVDDNGISLAAIEQVLKDEFDVIPINSGLRALQYLKKEKPDLILLDVQMALKDGIETLREIRQREGCKDIPVIMLTSLRDKDTVMESSKLGVEDYVIKPFNRKDLYDRVKRVLKKR
ncbi:MAG: response regulator [Blautia sp.]|nr:response regulator [Lachnoclostridium sp.]MCM1212068.1 response regulator [Blautia sp.]